MSGVECWGWGGSGRRGGECQRQSGEVWVGVGLGGGKGAGGVEGRGGVRRLAGRRRALAREGECGRGGGARRLGHLWDLG